MRLRDDARLRAVHWHDLRHLTRRQKVHELTLSLPWLALALIMFQLRWVPIGLLAAFFFFLAGLRQAHGAQHYTLGVNRRVQDCLLAVLSVLMLASLHALQATHLHHHKHTLESSDMEAATARLPWWRALLAGPWFIVVLNWTGYRLASASKRRWIRTEAVLIAVWVLVVWLWGPVSLRWFVAAMLAGECMTGFFAVWTVHHDVDAELQLARTQRGWWKNFVSYDMFYHVEHHLFPAVPTARLPELADRLDAVLPHLAEKQVY